MTRRRVSLRESLRKAAGSPGDIEGSGFVVALWYWIAGEPVPDRDEEGDGR